MSVHPPLCTAGYNRLSSVAHHFLTAGLATSTMAIYSAGKQRYLQFCGRTKVPAIPATETTLVLFVSYLATINISHYSIKVYLSAVRHMHITRGLHNEFNQLLTPRLHLTLRGIKRKQASTHPSRTRLPITIDILHKVRSYLSAKSPSYSNTMLWAMCCLAFFGFLRVGEFNLLYQVKTSMIQPCISPYKTYLLTVGQPSPAASYPKTVKDWSFQERCTAVHRSNRQENLSNQGIAFVPSCSGQPGRPLFITKQGRGITRQMFSSALDTLTLLKLDYRHYNTHSFRIGAATSAAQVMIPDSLIKMLGRWQSNAYQCYIKTPVKSLPN